MMDVDEPATHGHEGTGSQMQPPQPGLTGVSSEV
eukprot:CAMPEP_0184287738 /NCGR_PEP_ID=MMETSP1049-20130417/91_1 /TAXON_ID=77928 /ORGANISM="Proteomonas sulcata, Strain CCMP704" /LENGTH=33 /DNA_ID= /DNA_START= /DNA_END= /DNA_ORIENTATION=